jgi:hypothetical protein
MVESKPPHPVMQFKITLHRTDPLVWRRIEVPRSYSFWDLHVAIQDSMGWLDCHLHEFRFRGTGEPVRIGIPHEEDPQGVLPGWRVKITDYFDRWGTLAQYEYDFGDGWLHDVAFEAIDNAKQGAKCPRCIGGERACPPEDCGSIRGYDALVKILKNPRHKEYREMVSWLRGHAKNYWPFDPLAFNPRQVRFDNPRKRFERAFAERGV